MAADAARGVVLRAVWYSRVFGAASGLGGVLFIAAGAVSAGGPDLGGAVMMGIAGSMFGMIGLQVALGAVRADRAGVRFRRWGRMTSVPISDLLGIRVEDYDGMLVIGRGVVSLDRATGRPYKLSLLLAYRTRRGDIWLSRCRSQLLDAIGELPPRA